jgi:hypothetical protein
MANLVGTLSLDLAEVIPSVVLSLDVTRDKLFCFGEYRWPIHLLADACLLGNSPHLKYNTASLLCPLSAAVKNKNNV